MKRVKVYGSFVCAHCGKLIPYIYVGEGDAIADAVPVCFACAARERRRGKVA